MNTLVFRTAGPAGTEPADPAAVWSWPRVWAFSVTASLLIGVLEATHGYIGFTLAGQPSGGFTMPIQEATWPALLARALPSWLWIGLIMPGAVWLARRVPLAPEIRAGAVGLHFVAALLFAALFVIGASALRFSLFVQTVTGTPYHTVAFRYYAIYYNLFFVYYWTIVGVYSALRYHREARAREVEKRELEAAASKARLEALRRQLRPHFLFNLLNTISVLVLQGERRKAARTLTDLGRLLRVSFAHDSELITLGQELELIEIYVELHRLRLEDRLVLEQDIDPAARDVAIPTFLLQPLVENAIEHGVAQSEEGGAVRIEAAIRGARLEVTVTNPVPALPLRKGPGSGVGLANTRERISCIYPGTGRFDFTISGGLATARLVIPAPGRTRIAAVR